MVTVKKYIPNPLQCFKCQKFRHHVNHYTSSPVCQQCRQDASHHLEDTCKELKCVNCRGSYVTNSRACEDWKREKQVTKVKYTRDITFLEASRIIETNFPIWSYATSARALKPRT